MLPVTLRYNLSKIRTCIFPDDNREDPEISVVPSLRERIVRTSGNLKASEISSAAQMLKPRGKMKSR